MSPLTRLKKKKKSVFKAFRYLSFDLQTVQLGREENENVILSDLWLAGVGLALRTKKDELQQQESMMQLFRVLGITQALPTCILTRFILTLRHYILP